MTATLPDAIRTQAYIDGEFVDALDGATFDSFAPATGEVIAKVAACSEADVDRAVAAARAAFNKGEWSRIAPGDRKAVLFKFADLIEQHAEELIITEAIDAGKPIVDCRGFDLPDIINTIRWYAEAADKVFGKTSPTGSDHVGLIVREPVGVVGGVLPWNFPMAMLAWKLAPALATGNSVVIKPPELASLTTLRLAELATEAGIPAGVFNVVPGLGHIAGKALGLHMDVDMVSFTGSTEVGRAFLRYSADSNLKGIVLECGGKSPQIVMADCSDKLEEVAADLAEAAFFNAGQNCSAGSRILVHSSIKDDFVAALAVEADKRTVGDPTDESTVIGALIEPSALERVLGYIEQAKADGARIVTGGERVLAETGGYFAGATVIDEVTPQMSVAREEIFGPVVSVLSFDDVDEALALANDTPYGLAATVWSKDIDVALRTARSVRAGTVAVNGYSEGDIGTPFGGYKMSGFGGRDNGLEALEQYTEVKTIWITLH
ncbi:aldehyde dehydrogenase [Microlunatus phosphovorus NM-1]|uniref:Aldehyde dehydrogenase n=1 Tax=Microlunatus phosphovorus (strain ATCC 700054 / DSM 10555 / JCM 9379 / NBRC 101784 / NCIMB 13414 / VKM Ac-1990 / NM-1) TaxID=1032480 RepID=F5XFR7_MICPN|nr:aldehyde dehydrogenase [Microlunatus phosphovorus]BAK35474.1 aldehyde dehydrogenase [Microlunatus phosphovorus NM-1]